MPFIYQWYFTLDYYRLSSIACMHACMQNHFAFLTGNNENIKGCTATKRVAYLGRGTGGELDRYIYKYI